VRRVIAHGAVQPQRDEARPRHEVLAGPVPHRLEGDQLDDAAYERLVSALAMVLGWEALIVLADLRDLDEAERTETSAWAARTLIRAALEESHMQA
jgi:hypothetical protein